MLIKQTLSEFVSESSCDDGDTLELKSMSFSGINASSHQEETNLENKMCLSNKSFNALEEISEDELNTSLSNEVSFFFAKPNSYER